MNKCEALKWLVDNVKVWPTKDNVFRHEDLKGWGWRRYIGCNPEWELMNLDEASTVDNIRSRDWLDAQPHSSSESVFLDCPELKMNVGEFVVSDALGGLKHDQDKPMYNLIPANAIESLAKVLTFGANKYAPNSWQNVEDGLERYRAALLRHTFAMQRGELIDDESGLPHSAHAMCCAAFINELEQA